MEGTIAWKLFLSFIYILSMVSYTYTNPTDRHATLETTHMYWKLKWLQSNEKVMFGQHRATETGAEGGHTPYHLTSVRQGGLQGWKFTNQQVDRNATDELCDVKSLTGEYPAMTGTDLGQSMTSYRQVQSYLSKKAADRGMAITASWHLPNPVTGQSFRVADDHGDVLHSIRRILPGGDHNSKFLHELDSVATWLNHLRDSHGKKIPVIFRPFHEMNGNWFWWGTNSRTANTEQEYIELFRYVVEYLRDHKSVHNILYAYSPGKLNHIADYTKFYPGDDYVDILGMDFYFTTNSNPPVNSLKQAIKLITDYAHSKGKIAAITEIGMANNGIDKFHNFWVYNVLNVIKSGNFNLRLAYIFTWMNHCADTGRSCDLFIPYKGHPDANDFLSFYHDPITIFGSHVPQFYPHVSVVG